MITEKQYQIYQKTGEDDFVLMHPETSADNVLMSGESDGETVQEAITQLAGNIEEINRGGVVTSIRGSAESEGRKGDVVISKENLGLGNLTNDTQVKRTEMGAAGGVATLDASGRVPSSQLPSYVDDIIEGWYYQGKFYLEEAHTTEIMPESGKIYVDKSAGSSYRWSGTVYVLVSNPISIGTGQGDAYDGSAGAKNAADIEGLKNGSVYAGKATEADRAKKLSDEVLITVSGDASGEVSFDGSEDVTMQVALAQSGVQTGTYSAVQVNTKGIVTAGAQVIEVGEEGQESPSASLAIGGLFFKVI